MRTPRGSTLRWWVLRTLQVSWRQSPLLAGGLEQERGEHLLHPGDWGRLIGEHIGGEPEDLLLLSRALPEQPVEHGDRALVMLDLEGQEQPTEFPSPGAAGRRQRFA